MGLLLVYSTNQPAGLFGLHHNMSTYTLTYSDSVKGWPSFYSYYPDWMIGMNNYFYTFKGGDLYRHNDNGLRNTFYYDWWVKVGNPGNATKPSTLTSVFNQAVLENKLFKTITLQGDSAWDVTYLKTDLQDSGYIQLGWFEKKESAYFAFVRNNPSGELLLRSVNGIGNSYQVINTAPNIDVIKFSINPLVDIGSILSVGDLVYFLSAGAPVYEGKVTLIERNYPSGLNQITVDTTGRTIIPTNIEFFLYIKNSVAESHGVLGHYCEFHIENPYTYKVELYTVESEVMKSYP